MTGMYETSRLEADLRRAIDRGELRVVYQPIVSLETGAITGAEAFARWCRPGEAMPTTASFIPIAEATGLIVPIGRWVLAEACRQARQWQLESMSPYAPTMSVNVSVRQLENPSFTQDVKAILAESRFPASRLILEIGERALTSNQSTILRRLREIKVLGVRLAIDDCGTGYSNLSHLRDFPVDILKIDRSFVAHVDDNEGDAALASSIVALAGALKLHTVAEGIEHATQRAHLLALGCESGQGYLFSRPLGADVVGALIQSGRAAPGMTVA